MALERLGLLEAGTEGRFADLTALAATACDAPMAMVTLLSGGRAHFRSAVGMAREGIAVAESCSAYAVGAPEKVFVVEDLLADDRFAHGALATGPEHARAFAGVTIVDPHGTPLGTVAVLDTRPRVFTPAQRKSLRQVARQVMALLQLETRVHQLQTVRQALTASNDQLDQFAHIMAHDLLAPIRHQSSFAGLLEADYADELPPGASEYIRDIRRAGDRASDLIRDISTYVFASHSDNAPHGKLEVGSVVLEAFNDLDVPEGVSFQLESSAAVIVEANHAALYHILQNLLSNAAKFVDPNTGRIAVRVVEALDTVTVEVVDNGIGMSPGTAHSVFELFSRGDNVGMRSGRGLGLSIARKLARGLCGEITCESAGVGAGTTFRVLLPREYHYGVGG